MSESDTRYMTPFMLVSMPERMPLRYSTRLLTK